MRALILTAGVGRRLLLNDGNKCLVSVCGKPLLDYSMTVAASLEEIEDIVLVVGYQAESIISRYGRCFAGKYIHYVHQEVPLGVVDAIRTARSYLQGADFFLFLGDEVLLDSRHQAMVLDFYQSGAFVTCGVVRESKLTRHSKNYTIMLNDAGAVCRLIEKPEQAVSPWMGTGNCIFRSEIVHYLDSAPVNPQRGEQELPDLIQSAVNDGRLVRIFEFKAPYFNINTQEDRAEAEASLSQP